MYAKRLERARFDLVGLKSCLAAWVLSIGLILFTAWAAIGLLFAKLLISAPEIHYLINSTYVGRTEYVSSGHISQLLHVW